MPCWRARSGWRRSSSVAGVRRATGPRPVAPAALAGPDDRQLDADFVRQNDRRERKTGFSPLPAIARGLRLADDLRRRGVT
ncbi:MAG: hypothetical protein U0736_02600 [Gemmataceae bacterium]